MKYFLIILCSLIFTITSSAQYTVSSGVGTPYEYTDGIGGTGISKIYLLNTFSGASISYTSDAAVVRFYKYSRSLSDKVLIPYSDISTSNSGNNTTYTITNLEDSRGYFAEVNGTNNAVIWIIDYSKHLPQLNSIEASEAEDRCKYLKLLINKSDDLPYYATTGGKYSVIRKYKIEYPNFDGASKDFKQITQTLGALDIGTEAIIEAPLMNTKFTLSGDQFAEYFGLTINKDSKNYTAVATKAFMDAVQVNGIEESTILGGSAPAEVRFSGYGNEPTAHFYTWFIYNTSDLENPIVRYTDKNIRYTFNDAGTFRVVLEVADKNSFCADTVNIQLSISESELKVPNIFSPDANSEAAKVFRVTYKSLVKFKCTIFNRWGNKLYEWTDPSKGWDGKYNGKYVNTGVYFYAIDALGADGKHYKKAGDINVIRRK